MCGILYLTCTWGTSKYELFNVLIHSIKIYKTLILPFVLYECEPLFLIVR